MALEAAPRFPWRSACCQAPAVRGGAAPSPEPPPTAQQAVCTERGFPRLPGGITGQTPHQLPSQPENCSRRRSGCRLLHRMLRSLRSLRRPPSTPEKWTFQLWLDTRIDITAPLGDDGSDTTAHSCSVVASAATSTVHHYVATSSGRMDPFSEHVPLRRRPRPRLDLACQRNAAPALPQGSRPPLLTVPVAGNDMPVTAVSRAAWLEAPAGESMRQKSTSNRQRPSTVRSNARLPGCASAV